jgi:energy-converting hydrogenase B subunit Q
VGSNDTVTLALLVHAMDRPGVLHKLTAVIGDHDANIVHVDITDRRDGRTAVYFELEGVADASGLRRDLGGLDIVEEVEEALSAGKLFGKRIIVMGGGAQVGQVAVGAIAEADRHNIRGERISVDTIPLVGEQNLAAAVRGVARLPRVRALILAGSLMGGEITKAVLDVREKGIIVVSLNMAGSVPAAADLIVTDPLQAGVMTVMAIADTAKFDINVVRGRKY